MATARIALGYSGSHSALSCRYWKQLHAVPPVGTFICTSREVNEAKRPHTCSRPCVFEEKRKTRTKKNTKKSTAPETHHEIHSNSATATNSRRRATEHVPRVSPYSSAPIDPGFVEMGLVQLSQSVKTTNVTHTLTHTDRQIE